MPVDKLLNQSISRYIVTAIPIAKPAQTVGEIVNKIARTETNWDELESVFVTNEFDQPIGYIPIEKLFASKNNTLMQEIMLSPVPVVKNNDDQEEAAITAISNQMQSIPVINTSGKLIGAVPTKNILNILHSEHVEDILKSAGINIQNGFIDVTKTRISKLIKLRLPWLLIGLAGGILATLIVSAFEKTLQDKLALAFFIPIIVYMSDAVGTQTETLFIRELVITTKLNTGYYIVREAAIGAIIGLACGLLIFIFTVFWLHELTTALIVGITMFASMSTAVFIAILIPWLIKKTNRDPAFGSGPFATVLQDIISLTIYFLISSVILFA